MLKNKNLLYGNVLSNVKLSSAMSGNKVKTMTLLQGQILHIL